MILFNSLVSSTINQNEQNSIFRASSFEELIYALKIKKEPIAVANLGITKEDFLRVANSFGGAWDTPVFGKIRDLKVSNSLNGSVGSSQSFHPFHQDGVYCGKQVHWIMLQCVRNNGLGGQGLFLDLRKMLETMPQNYRTLLMNEEFVYERLREDGFTKDRYVGPIIFERDDGYGMRWRYDYKVRPRLSTPVTEGCIGLFHAAIAWVNNYIQVANPLTITYKPGDIIVVNNYYVVHGRTQILYTNRHFRRIWLKASRII